MTLDGLLAITGILIAIVAIADPIQRRSILMFVPRRFLLIAFCVSLLIAVYFRIAALWGVSTPPWLNLLFYMISFLMPIWAIVACIWNWHKAELTTKNAGGFSKVIDAAMREGKYDEVERILGQNKTQLKLLSNDTRGRVFDRKVVRTLLESRSVLHLELLKSKDILDKKEQSRFSYVDNVVRELVLSSNSPWRSAVVCEYGGYDSVVPLGEDAEIVEGTLGDPEWYVKASAHMSLLNTAVEALQSRRFDEDYNKISVAYASPNGISPRVNCPVYLSIKMEVLAIKAAVKARSNYDLHITDLWYVFKGIRDRSLYDPLVWEDSLADSDRPTPYAYLLYEVFHDLRWLITDAIDASCKRIPLVASDSIDAGVEGEDVASAGSSNAQGVKSNAARAELVSVDCQLVRVWSYCVWGMALAKGKVSEKFRIGMVEECLDFLLCLHCAPSEIPVCGCSTENLESWREELVRELKDRFGSQGVERQSLEAAFWDLDTPKQYVLDGREWLANELGILLK